MGELFYCIKPYLGDLQNSMNHQFEAYALQMTSKMLTCVQLNWSYMYKIGSYLMKESLKKIFIYECTPSLFQRVFLLPSVTNYAMFAQFVGHAWQQRRHNTVFDGNNVFWYLLVQTLYPVKGKRQSRFKPHHSKNCVFIWNKLCHVCSICPPCPLPPPCPNSLFIYYSIIL